MYKKQITVVQKALVELGEKVPLVLQDRMCFTVLSCFIRVDAVACVDITEIEMNPDIKELLRWRLIKTYRDMGKHCRQRVKELKNAG